MQSNRFFNADSKPNTSPETNPPKHEEIKKISVLFLKIIYLLKHGREVNTKLPSRIQINWGYSTEKSSLFSIKTTMPS